MRVRLHSATGLPDPDMSMVFTPPVANIAPRSSDWNSKRKETKLKKAHGDVVAHGPWGGEYRHTERRLA